MIANTPDPPYYAVIFSSVRTVDENGYVEAAIQMVNLAATQPGFLGVESARNDLGITVSYWESLEDIKNWKNNADHLLIQQKGKDVFYSSYKTRICKVERDYSFEK
jgi:heme-degrading monooxygenase HmoA